jgi:hypothetical protein
MPGELSGLALLPQPREEVAATRDDIDIDWLAAQGLQFAPEVGHVQGQRI